LRFDISNQQQLYASSASEPVLIQK
jgi:hypothetical protein